VIVLAGLSIAGITFTQIYWVRRALDLRENQFYRDVGASLRLVAQQIFEINKTPSPANNPVEQLSTNYFVVKVNGPIDANLLEFLLVTEFEKRNVTADFEYGVYDCAEQCMVGGNYISPKRGKRVSNIPEPPQLHDDGYYFAVHFPRMEANLISQMGIWVFSSAVMLLVIFFFIYTLVVILRQRRLSEVQKDFINNMTHEFKTPIATIAISTEVLKDPSIVHAPERLLNYATIIQSENQRLKQQVERVLQMAQLDKEDLGLKREVVDVNVLVQEAVHNIQPTLLSKRGHIALDLQAASSTAKVDRLHFANVFYNLLDNAIKYNKQEPHIVVKTENIGDLLIISVSDNGIGVDRENQRRIFQKFYRVPTGNVHDVKGFGLGLNYVKLMVEKHGGKVSVSSELNRGSTFTVEIPISR
jgi:two-component system phosphate regulon sensor histidine kinase PhoR